MKKFYIGGGFLVILVILWSAYHADVPLELLKEKYTDQYSTFFPFQGMDVHYRDQGEGPPLYLLHGTGASLHTWDVWTQKIVSKGYRVVRLDLPAYGLTGAHPDGDYSPAMYLGLLEALRNHLELDSLVIVGNSFGGFLSWQYAINHSSRVSKMVLLDPSGAPRKDSVNKSSPLIVRLARTKGVGEVLSKFTPRSIIEGNLKEVYYHDSLVAEETIDRYHELSLREGNRKAFIDRVRNPYQATGWEQLSTLEVPTLIMWGEQDEWIPVADAERFHQAIPNSRVLIYPALGHVPMEEDPAGTVDDVLSFISE
ncbi:MAG TPA: alpha/beta hydrolase [Cytophagales bacterium]|nr:alpha/beta hydrolase [Cytophagales bacterium]HAA21507.1 alpha/beta hydrolase [Cytophagales bacterium]HAP64640.1 alpha/beta hydrolase [Cytophagales bacterium]